MNLKLTERAVGDMARLKAFVAEHDPAAAERVAEKLLESLRTLTEQPFAGRSLEDMSVRQWVAGDYYYVARYVVRGDDEVIVVRIWHGREAR